ncbi:MAG: hypothetical protein HOI55_00200, partial [Candidatus Marinimicrobia bacterium]|nr:hypothetical protein [Candidatus Neomarinimicrobiota bacterium]
VAFSIGFGFDLGPGYHAYIQTHGSLQLIGWVGLFIMGVSIHFLSRLAWLSLIISIIIAFMANENRAGGFSILISLVSGLISFVFLLASSEIIKLYINIAKDLRSLKSSIIKDD